MTKNIRLLIKDKDNQEVRLTLILPEKECDFLLDSKFRVLYNDLELSPCDENDFLKTTKKSFDINCATLDKEAQATIFDDLKDIVYAQERVIKKEKEFKQVKLEFEQATEKFNKLGQNLIRIILNSAYKHKGILLNKKDIKIGDAFLTIEYKYQSFDSDDWVSAYLWTVVEKRENGLLYTEKIRISSCKDSDYLTGELGYDAYDLKDIIKNSNEAYRLTNEQRNKFKEKFITAKCPIDYKTLVDEIRNELKEQLGDK